MREKLKKLVVIWSSPNVWGLVLLGIASGLPVTLSSSTLQAWLTTAGVSIVDIGFFSLVGLPYVYKFLWSPVMDRFIPPFLGRRKGWIVLMQGGLIIIIALMAIVGVSRSLMMIAMLAFLMAFFSASQDIAIDAYRTDLLSPEERGLGSAIFIGGWRLGALLSGGIALIMAGTMGWKWTYWVMALVMLLNMLVTFFMPNALYEKQAPDTLKKAIVMPFKEFALRPYAIGLLIFVVIYKFSDAFALTLMSTFLLRDVGFSLVTVGAVFKIFGVFAIILGTLVGGSLIPYLRLFKALLYFGFLQALMNLMFLWLAIAGKHYGLLVVAVVLDNFAGGLSTAAFVTFLMSLCNHHYTATQFALLSALAAVTRVLVGPLAGIFVAHFGWSDFFITSFILGMPGLLLLIYLQKKLDFDSATIGLRVKG